MNTVFFFFLFFLFFFVFCYLRGIFVEEPNTNGMYLHSEYSRILSLEVFRVYHQQIWIFSCNFGQLLHRQWTEFKGTVLDNSKKDSPLLELLKSVFSMKIFISGKSKIITTRLNLTPWQRHLYKFISGFIQ